ncbi:unnamed protein product [Ranitomeya imitator]|uniref:Uncharacterized protein n=1 Tax=Ranitomeya imitator TaxID=111125 RepID=A0ABN9LTW0_9NEOB|nr:unnamed protein product [Ranitomeya imitator]
MGYDHFLFLGKSPLS